MPSGSGKLSKGGFQLLINGRVVETSTTFQVDSGYTHKVEIQTEGENFRGFFLRLSGNRVDASDAFSLTKKQAKDTQLFPNLVGAVCPPKVGGACHLDSSDKKNVSASMYLDETGTTTLEVTIVKYNNRSDGFDQTYYSSFNIAFVESKRPRNPTSAPTTSPPTFYPTVVPEPTSYPTWDYRNTRTPTVSPSKETVEKDCETGILQNLLSVFSGMVPDLK